MRFYCLALFTKVVAPLDRCPHKENTQLYRNKLTILAATMYNGFTTVTKYNVLKICSNGHKTFAKRKKHKQTLA